MLKPKLTFKIIYGLFWTALFLYTIIIKSTITASNIKQGTLSKCVAINARRTKSIVHVHNQNPINSMTVD